VTAVFTITVTDDEGATDTQDVTITITGANDVPIITVEAGDSDGATLTETDAALTSNGTLSVVDLDITDTVNVTVTSVAESGVTAGLASNNSALLAMLSVDIGNIIDNANTSGVINWTFDSSAEAFDYLAVGESLVLTYTVTVTDSQNATNTQTVTITINGTNEVPVETGNTPTEVIEAEGGSGSGSDVANGIGPNGVPLRGILGIFRNLAEHQKTLFPDRILGGLQRVDGSILGSGGGLFNNLVPYFAGVAPYGSYVELVITDLAGNEVARSGVFADAAGNWSLLLRGVALGDQPYTVEIRISLAAWESSTTQVFMSQFTQDILSGANGSEMEIGDIFGTIMPVNSVDAALAALSSQMLLSQ